MSHTPEPWIYDEKLPDKFYSDDATGSIIGECGKYDLAYRPDEERKANARRIVACVNACKGAQVEDLERLCGNYIKPLIDLIDENTALKNELSQERKGSLDCDDIKKLRQALSWMGVSTPESFEECGARQKHLVRDLIRAVLRHKALKVEGGDHV